MASSFSTDLKLELMVTGENAGTWGTKTNTNLNLLQQAIAGFQSISIAGGAQTTALTMDNAAISNARNAVVKLTGTITGNQVVTVPDGIEKTYIVQNGTVGVFTVQFKTASGTGVTFATTNKGFKIVYSDGTNIVDVELSSVNPIIEKILDTNGNEEIIFTATTSAVNELTIANAATGTSPTISATGSDTNIGINLTPKGTGGIVLGAGAVGTPALTTSGDLNTGIYFPAADTIAFTEGGAEAMRINSDGNVALAGNIGLGGATPTTSGTGITFPATASGSTDANTLDDYERGTFTPSFVNVPPSINPPSGTITSLSGEYVKIGKSVLCFIKVLGTNMAIAVYARLQGLPFGVDSVFDATGVFVVEISGAQSRNGFLQFSQGTGQGYMGNHTGTTGSYVMSITYVVE